MKRDNAEIELAKRQDYRASVFSIASTAILGLISLIFLFLFSNMYCLRNSLILGENFSAKVWPPNSNFLLQLSQSNYPVGDKNLFINCTAIFSCIYFAWLILRLIFELFREQFRFSFGMFPIFIIFFAFTSIAAFLPFQSEFSHYGLSLKASVYSNIWHTLLKISANYLCLAEILAKFISFIRFGVFERLK